MTDFEDFLESANAEFDAQPIKAPGKFSRQQFPCESCNSTGRWAGGTNSRGNSRCHARNGQGYFVTSEAERRKARAARAEMLT